MHPVLHFDKYLSIYGDELNKLKSKNQNYPTYNSKAEFRTSQRLVVTINDINTSLLIK